MRRALVIVSLIAIAHFMVTLPLPIFLGLSFSIEEARLFEPVLAFLTFPLRVIARTGIFDGLNIGLSDAIFVVLCLGNSLLYGAIFYYVGRIPIRHLKRIKN